MPNTLSPRLFAVSGMSCGGCVNAVKSLILKQDPQAQAEVDLEQATARIVSALPADRFTEALTKAGYPTKAQD